MRHEETNTLKIKTPEGIVFSLMLAGPVTRCLALSVDLLTISVIMSILNTLFAVLGILSRDIAAAVNILGYFAISIGYGIISEWFWQGQTLGKRLLHLRVMDVQGLRIQFSQIVIRNLLRFVDSLPGLYLVGGLASVLNCRAQRLGDIAANTIVVRNPRIPEPDLNQLLKGKYNSFRDTPHLEARLRQRVSPQQAQIALQALVRRDELDSQARIEVFHSLVSHFKTIVEFPAEASDGISDEQYIRNTVDILYRPKAVLKKPA